MIGIPCVYIYVKQNKHNWYKSWVIQFIQYIDVSVIEANLLFTVNLPLVIKMYSYFKCIITVILFPLVEYLGHFLYPYSFSVQIYSI